MFRQGTALNRTEVCQQLFSCCDDELGNDLLRNNTNILRSAEQDLLTDIKSLAVTPVAVSVRRAELFTNPMVKMSDHSTQGSEVRRKHAPTTSNALTQHAHRQ